MKWGDIVRPGPRHLYSDYGIVVSMGEYVSTERAAEHLRVSPRRVRKLLEVGDLSGERHAGVWLVDAKSVANKMSVLEDRHPARPLSPRMTQAVLHRLESLLDGKEEGDPVNLSPKEQSRVNAYIQRLCDPGGNPAALLRAWMRNHIVPEFYDYLGDPTVLLGEPGVQSVGLSDSHFGLSSPGIIEIAVANPQASTFIAERHLAHVAASKANVVLHRHPRKEAFSRAESLCCLAMHIGPREDEAVRQTLARIGV